MVFMFIANLATIDLKKLTEKTKKQKQQQLSDGKTVPVLLSVIWRLDKQLTGVKILERLQSQMRNPDKCRLGY